MEEAPLVQFQCPTKQPQVESEPKCWSVEFGSLAVMNTLEAQKKCSFCPAMKDHYAVESYHIQSFLYQRGHTLQL